MYRKKFIWVGFIFLAFFYISPVKGAPVDSPSEVVELYWSYLQEGDLKAASELWSKDYIKSRVKGIWAIGSLKILSFIIGPVGIALYIFFKLKTNRPFYLIGIILLLLALVNTFRIKHALVDKVLLIGLKGDAFLAKNSDIEITSEKIYGKRAVVFLNRKYRPSGQIYKDQFSLILRGDEWLIIGHGRSQ